MDWRDDAIVLSTRKLGENSVRLSVLTRDYGRYAGMVRGATSKSMRGTLEPGNEVRVGWSARLAEHLGQFRCELTGAHVADILLSPGPLMALSSACAMLEVTLPEREAHSSLYHGTVALLSALKSDQWLAAYIRWEVGLLDALGYALQFDRCAATDATEDLCFVSPKSGRAVSEAAGAAYRDRLLLLPAFLAGQRATQSNRETDLYDQCRQGLKLTGFFIHRDIFEVKGVKPVAARDRLVSHVWRLHDMVEK
ncbi:DNA repair protein RecO [Thalassospira alkalitolerans]|uniref:DNA repair protein RecO n=1 Tax=Thalassospira alkalitolerans TaxID=1293890 RepID=A0A1Y2LEU9_9PROT|nr:DNA repair protein RecO [Thalassospira alkalitolerans]OSQ48717.1 DNA recombination protein RecO [Thalassospira alkalitolerans]